VIQKDASFHFEIPVVSGFMTARSTPQKRYHRKLTQNNVEQKLDFRRSDQAS